VLWFLLLFQNLVKLTLCLCSQVLNSVYYCDNVLKQGLLPGIRRLSNDDFWFQQYGARAHCSCQTVAYLRSHMPEFIEPENWPPKQSASKACDFLNVGELPEMVYRHKNSDIDRLKHVLIDCCAQLSHDTLNQATDQLPKRLMMVIKVNGVHVELRLD